MDSDFPEQQGGYLAGHKLRRTHDAGHPRRGDGVVDEVQTEYSEDDLPLDPGLATVLLSWKERCPESEEGWMFPSPVTVRCYHASPIQQDYIRPAGRELGLGDVGWHTFRHYSDCRIIPGEERTKRA